MLPIMEKLASFLSCDLKTYVVKTGSSSSEVLSVSVSSIAKLESILVNYSKQSSALFGCLGNPRF
jgi:hypothetical protein